jgi:hypothetical protein
VKASIQAGSCTSKLAPEFAVMAQRDAIETMAVQSLRAFALLLLVGFSACSHTTTKSPDVSKPLIAHLTDTDGAPVLNAPEPEVVQPKSVQTVDRTLRVTVGNTAGDYVLVCNLDANTEVGPKSCSAPNPQRNYLLFRGNTKWLVKGAQDPIDLQFMQNYSVRYNDAENIGLLPAKASKEEYFRVFWLLSWTASSAMMPTVK